MNYDDLLGWYMWPSFIWHHKIPSLKLNFQVETQKPERKRSISSSNHQLSGANAVPVALPETKNDGFLVRNLRISRLFSGDMLVSGRVVNTHQSTCFTFPPIRWFNFHLTLWRLKNAAFIQGTLRTSTLRSLNLRLLLVKKSVLSLVMKVTTKVGNLEYKVHKSKLNLVSKGRFEGDEMFRHSKKMRHQNAAKKISAQIGRDPFLFHSLQKTIHI